MKNRPPILGDGSKDFTKSSRSVPESDRKTVSRMQLWIRNICVGVASLLFLLSFFLHAYHGLLRGIGYISGAAAYFFEFSILTNGFSRKVPHKELFMIYCFGPLYILMGLAYLLE